MDMLAKTAKKERKMKRKNFYTCANLISMTAAVEYPILQIVYDRLFTILPEFPGFSEW